MLRSMTGFGSAQTEIAGASYSVELRSVNGRYFKASLRLPEQWTHAEADFEKLLRERLVRGTVNLSLRMRLRDEAAAYVVNSAALERYAMQARAALGEEVGLDAGALLALPGVCEPPSADELRERGRAALTAAVNEAIDALLEMRRREGVAMAADLAANCQALEGHLGLIDQRRDAVVEDYRRRLTARVNELINAARISVDEQDLLREVAVFAERSDIGEEVARLRSHLEQFRGAMEREEQAGRKLDFICQEMLREANTIGSKANDADISRSIVEIKTAIDRIKEQVQNVE